MCSASRIHPLLARWGFEFRRSIRYCAPVIYEVHGERQLVIWDSDAVSAVNPETGNVFWSVNFEPTFAMSIGAPQIEDNILYVMAFNRKSAAIRIAEDNRSAEILWTGTGEKRHWRSSQHGNYPRWPYLRVWQWWSLHLCAARDWRTVVADVRTFDRQPSGSMGKCFHRATRRSLFSRQRSWRFDHRQDESRGLHRNQSCPPHRTNARCRWAKARLVTSGFCQPQRLPAQRQGDA